MKKKKTDGNSKSYAAPGTFQQPKGRRQLSRAIETGLEVRIIPGALERIKINIKKPSRPVSYRRNLEISLDAVRKFKRSFTWPLPLGQYIAGYFSKQKGDIQGYPDAMHLLEVKFLGEAVGDKCLRKFYMTNKGKVMVVEIQSSATGSVGRIFTCAEWSNDCWTGYITEKDAKKMLDCITRWIHESLSTREQDVYHLKCHPLYEEKKAKAVKKAKK